jgi:MFS family permease
MDNKPENQKSWMRWLVLLVISLVMFGSYYVYDCVSPINDYIQKSMGIGNSQYGLLYTFYSIPNLLFLVVFAGVLLDKIGIRRAGVLFAGLCALGSLITAFAADKSLAWMLVGRLIFGFGSESVILVVNKVIAKWFKGKELGFAFGLNITICRFGTFLALNSSAQIRNWLGDWTYSIWAGAAIMLISFLCFIIYIGMDRERDKLTGPKPEEKFIVKDVLRFGPSFWYVAMLCVTFYSAIFPFQAHAPRFLQMKWGMTAARSGFYTSILIFASMVCTPLFGLMVDKIGRRGSIMILGSILLIPAHLLFGYTRIHPAIPFAFMGLAFSLVPAAMWPSVPVLIKDQYLGTAYGLIGWIQNIGLSVFPWFAGKLVDFAGRKGMTGGAEYTYMEIMFSCLGIAGLLFSFLLLRADRIGKTGLELPSKDTVKAGA